LAGLTGGRLSASARSRCSGVATATSASTVRLGSASIDLRHPIAVEQYGRNAPPLVGLKLVDQARHVVGYQPIQEPRQAC
jgi:hypothetical protein